jgi:hypothetical protein
MRGWPQQFLHELIITSSYLRQLAARHRGGIAKRSPAYDLRCEGHERLWRTVGVQLY